MPIIGKDDGYGGESKLRPMLGNHELSSYGVEEKPAKKMRTGMMGGNIISRFLNSAQPYRIRV